jgi:hypothetical protein
MLYRILHAGNQGRATPWARPIPTSAALAAPGSVTGHSSGVAVSLRLQMALVLARSFVRQDRGIAPQHPSTESSQETVDLLVPLTHLG